MVTGFEGVLTEIDNDGPVGRPTDSVERVLVLAPAIVGLLSGMLSSAANGEMGRGSGGSLTVPALSRGTAVLIPVTFTLYH